MLSCVVIYFAIHLSASASAAFSDRVPLLLPFPIFSQQAADTDPSGRGERRSVRRGRSEFGYFQATPRQRYCFC